VKYFISILLVFSFLAQNVSKLIIIINFGINREYIAKNLCVKKDEPENCCHGKCELKKKLTEEDKKENLPVNTFKDKSEKQNYFGPALNVFASNQLTGQPQYNYLTGGGIGVVKEVFHPPSFLS
jgi:hypothetical protein